jgi:tyrosyl-DNA phosphodiesterase 2
VGLRDVWGDEPLPTPPVLKPFQRNITYGKARGNTRGYQSDRSKTRKLLDKFLYTGSIETFALSEAQDSTGRLGRFGIGLKIKVGLGDVCVSDHFGSL